jgi:hypothetical protein
LIIPILWHTAKGRQQPETVFQSSISTARLEEIAQLTLLAAEEIQRFGLQPEVALPSHSHLG